MSYYLGQSGSECEGGKDACNRALAFELRVEGEMDNEKGKIYRCAHRKMISFYLKLKKNKLCLRKRN